MPRGEYEIFEALNPFFEVVIEGLHGLVDGDHYFDTVAEDAFFAFRYRFPGWPLTIRHGTDRWLDSAVRRINDEHRPNFDASISQCETCIKRSGMTELTSSG